MISKHITPGDDDRARTGARQELDRDEARRAADRSARDGSERRLGRESGVPYVVPNAIDRPDDEDTRTS